MTDEDLEKRADVIARLEAAQWPAKQREKIRRLVRAVWLQGYKRGRIECLTTKTNDDGETVDIIRP
jgi:hypothetical protein